MPTTGAQARRICAISSVVTMRARHAASNTNGLEHSAATSAPCSRPTINAGLYFIT